MIDLGGSWPREQAVSMTAIKQQRQIWRSRRSNHREDVRTIIQACRRCTSLSKQAKVTEKLSKDSIEHNVGLENAYKGSMFMTSTTDKKANRST